MLFRSHVGNITFECMYAIVSGGEERRRERGIEREKERGEAVYETHRTSMILTSASCST